MRTATASSGAVEKATRTSASVEAATMGEPSVLRESEAIRHARDVVGDRAGFAVRGEVRAHLLRNRRRIASVHAPQFFEDALGLLGRRDHVECANDALMDGSIVIIQSSFLILTKFLRYTKTLSDGSSDA